MSPMYSKLRVRIESPLMKHHEAENVSRKAHIGSNQEALCNSLPYPHNGNTTLHGFGEETA